MTAARCEIQIHGGIMRLRKKNLLLNVLLGTGLYLLDSAREQLSDQVEEFSDRARDSYEDLRDRGRDVYKSGSRRVSRAAEALRGEDHHALGTAAALLVGVGVGVAAGLLFAPASGEETRNNLTGKIRDFGERAKERFDKGESATGTYGN
jgi:gas vesicle protein